MWFMIMKPLFLSVLVCNVCSSHQVFLLFLTSHVVELKCVHQFGMLMHKLDCIEVPLIMCLTDENLKTCVKVFVLPFIQKVSVDDFVFNASWDSFLI